jgi:23S rRNA (adenine2503-C2)-methyltransferase
LIRHPGFDPFNSGFNIRVFMKRSLVDHDTESFRTELQSAGFSGAHAPPVLRSFYSSGTLERLPEQIGPRVANWLREHQPLPATRLLSRHQSSDGTVKLLLALRGEKTIEAVLMPAHRPGRAAGCVSSQVGCAMGCTFCASTRGGLDRSLRYTEIVEQFLHLKREAAQMDRRLTSLVFMGMGEPMHNLENVIAAIRRIADPDLGGLGWRQITVSTVGIVPGIDALADADLNVHLALSLHAADDETRSLIVPLNHRYPVADIMAAARRFADRTRRVPTIEYCMLADINDSPAHADRLAQLMTGFRAHVNLIPYNTIPGATYRAPNSQTVSVFLNLLREAKVVVHVRETRGDPINAACGQLRQLQTV